MQINSNKTKEMLLGSIAKTDIPPLNSPAGIIERVFCFKLLGVHIESSLSWSTHIQSILKKVTCRLHFLKQLKQPAISSFSTIHLSYDQF